MPAPRTSRTSGFGARLRRSIAAGLALSLVGGVLGAGAVSSTEPAPFEIYGDLPERYFSPDGDGFEDVYEALLSMTEQSSVTVSIRPATGGDPIFTLDGSTVDEEGQAPNFAFTWDGLDANGVPVEAGQYLVELTATATDGTGTGSTSGTLGVERGGFTGTWEAPAEGSVLHRGDLVTVRVTDDRLAYATLEVAGTETAVSSSQSWDELDPNLVHLSALPGGVPDGPTPLEAVLVWFDPLNSWHERTIAPRTFDLQSSESLDLLGSPSWIYPDAVNRFGEKEQQYVGVDLGREATLTAVLRGGDDTVARTFYAGETCIARDCSLWMNGRTGEADDAPLLPEGAYTLDVSAAFASGNVLEKTLDFHVSHAVPTLSITAPAAETVFNGPAELTVDVHESLTAEYGNASVDDGEYGRTIGWLGYEETRAPGAFTIPIDTSNDPDGPISVSVDADLRDPLGGSHSLTSAPVAYAVANAVIVTADTAPATIAPEANPPVTSVATTYSVSRDATVTTVVEDAAGTVVRTLEDAQYRWAGSHSVTWDGTGDDGQPVENNADYTLRISASVPTGAPGEATRTISVARADVGTLTADPAGPTVTGTVTITLVPKDGVTPTDVTLYDADSGSTYPVGYFSQQYDEQTFEPFGPWTATVATDSYRNGTHRLYAEVTTETGGGQTPRLSLTYANPVELSLSNWTPTVHPDDATRDRWRPSLSTAPQAAQYSVQITDELDELVREISTTTPSTSWDFWWDGRRADGSRVPDGDYTATFTATEPLSATTDTQSTTVTVVSEPVGTVTSPAADSVVPDLVSLTYTPALPEDAQISYVQFTARKAPAGQYPSTWTLGSIDAPTDGVWRLTDADTSFLSDGAYELYASVSWSDANGYHDAGTPAVPVSVKQPGAIASVSPGKAFSPDGDGYEDSVGIDYRVARKAVIERSVVRADGTSLGVTSTDDGDWIGMHGFGWDGRDGNGDVVEPGLYTVRLEAVDELGETDSESVTVEVLGGPPGTFTGPGDAEPSSGTIRFTWTPAAGVTTDTVYVYADRTEGSSGEYVGQAVVDPATGIAVLDVNLAKKPYTSCGYSDCSTLYRAWPNGPHAFHAEVEWTDALGVQRTGTAAAYETPPAKILALSNMTTSLSPASGMIGRTDSLQDELSFAATLSADQPVTTTAVVRSGADGPVVRTLEPSTTSAYTAAVIWDGTNDAGAEVPDGDYTITVTATEPYMELQSVETALVQVRRTTPGTWLSPEEGATVSGGVVFRYQAASGVTLSNVELMDGSGYKVADAAQVSPGVWEAVASGSDGTTYRLPDGENVMGLRMRWRTATTTTGVTYSWTDHRTVTVQNTAGVSDIDKATYFTPDNDGHKDGWSTKYTTSAMGLTVEEWITDGSGAVVRDLASVAAGTAQKSNGAFGPCEERNETVTVNDQPSYERTWHVCDNGSWDGRDDKGVVVPDGIYTFHVKVTGVDGSTAQASQSVGVETDSPILTSLADGDVVADALQVTYTRESDHPIHPQNVPVITTGVSGVIAAQTAQGQTGGGWATTFDLPTSLPDALTFMTIVRWTDGWGGEQVSTRRADVTVDTTTLDLAFSSTAPTGYDPHPQEFVLTVPETVSSDVAWSVDPGDGTAAITGSMPAGTRTARVPHTYSTFGSFTATAVVTDASGNRRHDYESLLVGATPPARPVVDLDLSPARGVAPVDVTATLSATVSDGSSLRYHVEWGDGTSASGDVDGQVQLSHTYTEPGTYLPVARVTASLPDRTVTSTGTDSASVVVGKAEPLLARISDGDGKLTTIDGKSVLFDASSSSGTFELTDGDVVWDFGDETSANGIVAEHVYDVPGTYLVTVRMTAADGATSSDTQTVVVLDSTTASVSTITVTAKGGGPLGGAQLVRSVGDDSVRAVTGPDGTAVVYGLPDGVSSMDVYVPDYQPGIATVTVSGGTGTGSAELVQGALADVAISSAPITDPSLLEVYGIDPDAEENKNFVEYEVQLHYSANPDDPPLQLRGVYNDRGAVGYPFFVDPTDPNQSLGSACVEKGADGLPHPVACSSGGALGGSFTPEIKDVGEGQKALVVAFQPKTGMLKEFFDVQVMVQLLAAPGSTASLDDVTATLSRDKDGLGLPALHGVAQSDVKTVDRITADAPTTFSWVLRGDAAGTYPVTVDIAAVLQPFAVPVSLAPEKPVDVKVYGNTAYRFIVQAPTSVVKDQPTRVRMGFENVTPDLPLHGLTVELTGDNGKFLFQPNPETGAPASEPVELLEPLMPGERRLVDFPILPTFTGEIDLTKSTIVRTKGVEQNGTTPEDLIEPLDPYADEDPANPPTVEVTPSGDGQVTVTWSEVKPAQKYHVYVEDSLTDGFGKPVASTSDGSTRSLTFAVPESYSESSDSSTGAMRMQAYATSGDATLSAVKKVVVQSVVNGANQLRHPVKDAFASCGGGVDATYGDWDLQGCLNKQADGWLAVLQPDQLIKLNGLVIEPAGTSELKVKMTTADGTSKGRLSTNASTVKVGFDAGPLLGVIPLYEGPLTWDLNQPISFSGTAKDVLGLPVAAAMTVTTDGAGRAKLTTKASSPAVLGGAAADVAFTSDNTTGLHLDALKVEFAKGSLAGAEYSGSLTYKAAAAGERTWNVAGTAKAGTADAAVTGSLAYNADGTLAKGELHATGLQLLGAAKVDKLDLTTTGGSTWHAAVKAEVPGGTAVDGTVDYVVDQKTNTVTSAKIALGKLVLRNLLDVTDFVATYAGDAEHAWAATGKIATTRAGAPVTSFKGTWVTTAEGVVSSGTLDVSNLPFADLFTVKDLQIAYAADTATWSGSIDLSTPGSEASAGSGSFRVVNRVLEDLTVRLTDARLGGLLRITDGEFRYSKADASYALSATTADVANLVGITDFEASRVGKTWTLNGTGPDASGKVVTMGSTMTFADGGITSGSLDLSGLSFGGLVPVDAVRLAYSPAEGWAVAGGGGEGALSFDVAVKDGAVVSAAVDIPDAKLAGVADVAFTASYTADGEKWSAGAKVDVPGGAVKDFALDMTYEKGVFTAGSISGTLGLKGGLVAEIEEISYDGAEQSWAGAAKIVMPGPAQTAVGGSIRIVRGMFESGEVFVENLKPGLPLGSGIFLTDAKLAVALEPEVLLSGTIGLAAGPGEPISISSTISVRVRDDGSAVYAVDGQLFIVGNELAAAGLSWDTLGIAAFHGHLGYGVAPFARVDADLRATVDASGFRALASAEIVLLGQGLNGQVLADQVGVTACAQYPGMNWSAGFTSTWSGAPQVIEQSCSIGGWSSPSAGAETMGAQRRTMSGLRTASTGDVVFTVPQGLPVYATEFVGTSSAPDVTLTGPSGESYTTTGVDGADPDNRFVVLRDSERRTTYVLLDRPSAGSWSATVVGGDNPLASSRVAAAAPAPQVTGALSGDGTTRHLDWTVGERVGQVVQFLEVGPDGTSRLLGTADGTSGRLTFSPTPGDGTRTIKAVVEQDGAVSALLDLGTYTVTDGVVTQPGTGGGTDPGTGGGGTDPGTGGGGTDPGTGGGSPSPSPTPSPTASATPTPTPGTGGGRTTVLEPGGTAASDEEDGVSADNPMRAQVTVPDGGEVALTEQDAAAVDGFSVLGQAVQIEAPAATVQRPLTLTFEVHVSQLPEGVGAADVDVLRDGVAAGECSGSSQAVPDPCVAERSFDGQVLRLVVRSSHASTWSLATDGVSRIAGADRLATAVQVSRASFPSGNAGAVVLARADGFADALAGTPLAAELGAPLLLTSGAALSPATRDELLRVLERGGEVHLLGGPAALSESVEGQVRSLGYVVRRHAGADRYATAVAVARALGDPATVLLATGLDFADSLSAGVAAGHAGGAVLLTAGDRMPAATAEYLADRQVTQYAIGGPATRAAPTAVPVTGADRYATAVSVAREFFSQPTGVGLASGMSFADALAAGPQLVRAGRPLLLAAPTALPAPTAGYLSELATGPTSVRLYGGAKALGAAVEAAAGEALR